MQQMINENNINLFEQSIGSLDNEEQIILKARMKNNYKNYIFK